MVLALLVTLVVPAGGAAQVPDLDVYDDVGEDAWYYGPVGVLALEGVLAGTDCSEGFCPGDPLARWQMAVWLVRVLDEEDPEPITELRFGDVAADGFAAPFIERLAELGVTAGCGDGSVFCPGTSVSRAQMAVFLYRAFGLPEAAEPAGFSDVADDHWAGGHIDSLAASGITAGCKSEPFSFCPGRSVTKAQMATFLFRAMRWQREQAQTQQQPDDQQGEVEEERPESAGNRGTRVVEDANPGVFLTEENELSRFIRNKIVAEYAEENPWLMEVWNYTNQPGFEYSLGRNNATLIRPSYESTPTLLKVGATVLSADNSCLADSYCWTNLIHEMAHVYTLVNGISTQPAALAAAHLYFEHLARGACNGKELYVDAAQFLVPTEDNIYSPYWHSCEHLPQLVTAEAEAVVRDAFSGWMPQWFYDTFQRTDGSLDYEAIWAAVKELRHFERVVVVYQFRDAFGGYCSEQAAKDSAFGDLELAQPWRDGGCHDQ